MEWECAFTTFFTKLKYVCWIEDKGFLICIYNTFHLHKHYDCSSVFKKNNLIIVILHVKKNTDQLCATGSTTGYSLYTYNLSFISNIFGVNCQCGRDLSEEAEHITTVVCKVGHIKFHWICECLLFQLDMNQLLAHSYLYTLVNALLKFLQSSPQFIQWMVQNEHFYVCYFHQLFVDFGFHTFNEHTRCHCFVKDLW